MIKIELLTAENFKPDSLDNYQRRQEVRRVYRKHDGIYQIEECVYLEDWDREKRRYVAKEISSNAYITYLALKKEEVVGFIGLKKDLIGDYMILDQMHVSAVCRGQGIGRNLFEKGKEEAKKARARALYISACSSVETIAFYKAMGARLTDCPIKELAEAEPYDLQMICDFYGGDR